MWSRLLAVLLVLAMWPALGETVETVVHLAEHGDLAHDPTDHPDENPLGSDEHGCSGMFHLCATGHVSVTYSPIAPASVRRPAPPQLLGVTEPLEARGQDAPMPPIRPPIA